MNVFIKVDGVIHSPGGPPLTSGLARLIDVQFREWLSVRGLVYQGVFDFTDPPPAAPGTLLAAGQQRAARYPMSPRPASR